jgi:hypothetical protein
MIFLANSLKIHLSLLKSPEGVSVLYCCCWIWKDPNTTGYKWIHISPTAGLSHVLTTCILGAHHPHFFISSNSLLVCHPFCQLLSILFLWYSFSMSGLVTFAHRTLSSHPPPLAGITLLFPTYLSKATSHGSSIAFPQFSPLHKWENWGSGEEEMHSGFSLLQPSVASHGQSLHGARGRATRESIILQYRAKQ